MVKGITLGIAANGNVTLITAQGEVKNQVENVVNSTTLGNTYASCEVWDTASGIVCCRVFDGVIDSGVNMIAKASDKSMDYKGTAPTYTFDAIGLLPNDSVDTAITGTPVYTIKDSGGNVITPTTANAGTYSIVLSGLSVVNENQYAFSMMAGTLTINKLALTVTAENKSIKEGGAAPAYSAIYSGFASGESTSNLTGSLTYTIKDAEDNVVSDVSAAAPGNYKIVPAGYTATNYSIKYVDGTLTITALPDITITADDKTMTAGGSAPTYTATATGDFADGEDISDLSGTLSYTIKDGEGNVVSDVTTAEAGTYQIIPSGLTSDDYDIHFAAGTLTIASQP